MATIPEVLKSLGLNGEYSPEAVDTIDAELAKLEPTILKARSKRLEARDAQKVIGNQYDDLIAVRGALLEKRDSQPGDVTVG